jgi:cellobionic acid phosphorylase
LFNTGTVHWIFRSLIDGLFGLQGEPAGLRIDPQLPKDWERVHVTRLFRKAEFHIDMIKKHDISGIQVFIDGQLQSDNIIKEFTPGNSYRVDVQLPFE